MKEARQLLGQSWAIAKLAARVAGILLREKLRSNFRKWNRGDTGKSDGTKKP